MIHQGDALTILRTLPSESVNCVVTSPPYWGLRDYGTATWKGGDPVCDHAPPPVDMAKMAASSGLNLNKDPNKIQSTLGGSHVRSFKNDCPKCGARRIDSQLGLESTPEEYVSKMVEVFREVRRVLKDDGVLWLNLGDSYATGGRGGGMEGERGEKQRSNQGALLGPKKAPPGLKPKDLCGIPWRVAFALQADGWYLRCDVIWAKPNPMPESVTDRPTKAHEYLFLMSKSERYWYNADAIAEPASCAGGYAGYAGYAARAESMGRVPSGNEKPGMVAINADTRNARSVWTIAAQPFKEAHFATFPPTLAKRCILAGCPKDGVVLDPFLGSGTTAVAAKELSRKWLGIELKPEYIEMAQRRLDARPEALFAS